jgi:acid phosphatase type 7
VDPVPKGERQTRRSASWLALCLALSSAAALAAPQDEPPRFAVPVADPNAPLNFVTEGDTRFTERDRVANPGARRALVAKIASENPAAILIGGDLVYQGSDPDDYATYKKETAEWAERKFPLFPALGNHEFSACHAADPDPCLTNWWSAFETLHLKPFRWYSVTIGPKVLALVLDSDSALRSGSPQRGWFEREIAGAAPEVKFILVVLHYPPVRDPLFPRAKDEAEVARYFSKHAKSLRPKVVVIGSHVHNYERYSRDGVTYLVSGGGGAKPVPAPRMFGELSQLRTSVNFHYLRFILQEDRLSGTMVRFDATDNTGHAWSEPDHFEVTARN